jgi:hypothetical protein
MLLVISSKKANHGELVRSPMPDSNLPTRSVRRSIRPFVRLLVCLSACQSVRSTCLSVYPSNVWSVFPSIGPFVRLSVCLSIHPTVCLSFHLSVRYVHPSVCSVCPSCLSIHLPVCCLCLSLSTFPTKISVKTFFIHWLSFLKQ